MTSNLHVLYYGVVAMPLTVAVLAMSCELRVLLLQLISLKP